jgi:hypothetical protein
MKCRWNRTMCHHNTAKIQHSSISKVAFNLFFKPVVSNRFGRLHYYFCSVSHYYYYYYYYSLFPFFPRTMNLSTADLRNYWTEIRETWWSYRYMFLVDPKVCRFVVKGGQSHIFGGYLDSKSADPPGRGMSTRPTISSHKKNGVKFYVSIIIHLEVININVRNFNFPIGFYSNAHPLWTPQNMTLTPFTTKLKTLGPTRNIYI